MGCEIVAYQLEGLVKMEVSDSDSQKHDLGCCMHSDINRNPIRKYYFFTPNEHRQSYSKALDQISHVENNKYAKFVADPVAKCSS